MRKKEVANVVLSLPTRTRGKGVLLCTMHHSGNLTHSIPPSLELVDMSKSEVAS